MYINSDLIIKKLINANYLLLNINTNNLQENDPKLLRCSKNSTTNLPGG